MSLELGVMTFGDLYPDPVTGERSSTSTRLKQLVERAKLADEVGLDYFGVGEHHRPDYAGTSPTVVLAAMGQATSRIRLGTAVTVLSTEDPVRLFEAFATMDQMFDGRMEIGAGRGAFTESFPLYGGALSEYEELAAEKLDLLLRLNSEERITWRGSHRPSLRDAQVLPRPFNGSLDIWLATGGTPASTDKAARLGLPVMYSILGGTSTRLAAHVARYRDRWAAGHEGSGKVSVSMIGFLAEDSRRAKDTFFPYWKDRMRVMASERGFLPPDARQYEMQTDGAQSGALMVGSPAEIAERLLEQREALGHDRSVLQMDWSSVPHRDVMRAIELLGTEVLPQVRAGA